MPLSTVSNAIYSYLDGNAASVPALGTVYQALPKVENEQDLFTNSYPGLSMGGTIYMHITSQYEQRIAYGGEHNGRKLRPYDLGLLIVFKSDLPSVLEGQQGYYNFIDGLTALIQADRTAGTAADSSGPYAGTGIIFQWGESDTHTGPDIRFNHFVPRTKQGGVTIFQSVGHITVDEILDT